MGTPRQKTEQEVRNEFLGHVRHLVEYWNVVPNKDCNEKLYGLAFSILVAIDGYACLPGFILAPRPHESDKEYNIKNGDNYYPENHESNVKCDIAGSLHDEFYNK